MHAVIHVALEQTSAEIVSLDVMELVFGLGDFAFFSCRSQGKHIPTPPFLKPLILSLFTGSSSFCPSVFSSHVPVFSFYSPFVLSHSALFSITLSKCSVSCLLIIGIPFCFPVSPSHILSIASCFFLLSPAIQHSAETCWELHCTVFPVLKRRDLFSTLNSLMLHLHLFLSLSEG